MSARFTAGLVTLICGAILTIFSLTGLTASAQADTVTYPYEVTVVWQMPSAPNIPLNTQSPNGPYIWPQTRLASFPAGECGVITPIQQDEYTIDNASEATYLAGLTTLTSPDSDAQLHPHNYFAENVEKPASECQTPTPAPSPSSTPSSTPTGPVSATPVPTPSTSSPVTSPSASPTTSVSTSPTTSPTAPVSTSSTAPTPSAAPSSSVGVGGSSTGPSTSTSTYSIGTPMTISRPTRGVDAAKVSHPSSLASTGAPTKTLLGLAVALLAGGLFLMLAGRRRSVTNRHGK